MFYYIQIHLPIAYTVRHYISCICQHAGSHSFHTAQHECPQHGRQRQHQQQLVQLTTDAAQQDAL